MFKKNGLEKLVSFVKNEAPGFKYLPCKVFIGRISLMNGVSTVISWERDVKTRENMWTVFKTNAWA